MMFKDDYKTATVYFYNGLIWRGPADMVGVEYLSDIDMWEGPIGMLARPIYSYRMEVTIRDSGMTIQGDAKRVTIQKKRLPKLISYGE